MEEEHQQSWGMRTRRLNKIENKKTKMMIKALEHAEKNQKPDMEGELPDMPLLNKDDEWGKKKKKKSEELVIEEEKEVDVAL